MILPGTPCTVRIFYIITFFHSSTSTTSSCLDSSLDFSKNDEIRLRDHISNLKTVRSSILGSIVEVESVHVDQDVPKGRSSSAASASSNSLVHQVDLEQAVLQQEVMAGREEVADLKAKIYLFEKEKSNLNLMLSDKAALEEAMRSHIKHLQEELALKGQASHARPERESELRERVEQLFATLEKVAGNSELRQRQSCELIEDLKKANR